MIEMASSVVVLVALVAAGVLWGRILCGKVCPIGLLQDLLFKIPFFRKVHSFKADKYLRFVKYGVLVLWLIATLAIGFGDLSLSREVNPDILTSVMALIFVALCVLMSRPFCKYLCPAAVVLGLFNLLPFNRYKLNKEMCVQCGICTKNCKVDIVPYDSLASIECIRCGRCIKTCPCHALTK
jgi:polyferredoxin